MVQEKHYRDGIDFTRGYPAAEGLYYECQRCGDSIASLPRDSTHCSCRNVLIDVDAGRISIQDHAGIRVFELEGQ
jgi:hypothetical protein